MTLEEQKERMITGKLYNDLTEELVNARKETVRLTDRYNRTYGEEPQVREQVLKQILGSMGENVFFEPSFRCEFGFNIHIGNDFYANFDCVMLDGGGIEIGDHVLFGPRVGIYTTRHAFDAKERAAGACFARPVKIETMSDWGRGTYRLWCCDRGQFHHRGRECHHQGYSSECGGSGSPLQGDTANIRGGKDGLF